MQAPSVCERDVFISRYIYDYFIGPVAKLIYISNNEKGQYGRASIVTIYIIIKLKQYMVLS